MASGTHLMGRFDSGILNEVRGIPSGAECSVVEKDSGDNGADEPHARWTARWTVADGPTGFEIEEACANHEGCATTDRRHAVTVTVPSGDDDNFLGTVVVWNTYIYDKVSLSVDKVLTGDGPELAGAENFSFALVCTDPAFVDSGLGDLPFVPDPTQRASFTVTGAGSQDEILRVPVGYECELVEQRVNGYDATITAEFSGPGVETTGQQNPAAEGGATGEFTAVADFANSDEQQRITVTNDYVRPRAALNLSKEFGSHPNSVASWLNSAPFSMSWTCEDPFTTNTREGEGPVDAGGDALRIENLPASAVCSVSVGLTGHIPEGREVNSAHRVEVFQGAVGGDPSRVYNDSSISDVTLDSDQETHVRFTNTYWVDQVQLRVVKIVEGDPDGTILGDEFTFAYRCEYPNLLPGQPAPLEPEGTATIGDGGLWSTPNLPVGSTCEVTEVLDDERELPAGLRLQPNYIDLTGDATIPVDEDGNPVIDDELFADEVRIPLNEGDRIRLGGEGSADAVVFNSLYRTDGEIQVLKVNPDGEPLPGASFAIHPADESGGMSPDPVVENLERIEDPDNPGTFDESRFTARLVPGTYFLVETKAGERSQLLPHPWQFRVVPDANNPELGNLKFGLESRAAHSGLVELVAPQPAEGEELDGTEPWVIKVANVALGEMPLTGGRGLTGLLGGGVALLVLAAVWRIWTRRRS